MKLKLELTCPGHRPSLALEVEVDYSYYGGSPAIKNVNHPGCGPAEPAEVEIEAVWLNGEDIKEALPDLEDFIIDLIKDGYTENPL